MYDDSFDDLGSIDREIRRSRGSGSRSDSRGGTLLRRILGAAVVGFLALVLIGIFAPPAPSDFASVGPERFLEAHAPELDALVADAWAAGWNGDPELDGGRPLVDRLLDLGAAWWIVADHRFALGLVPAEGLTPEVEWDGLAYVSPEGSAPEAGELWAGGTRLRGVRALGGGWYAFRSEAP